MTQYLLSMHYDDAEAPPADELDAIMADVERFNEALRTAGAWVFTAGLEPAKAAFVVHNRGGKVATMDGPYLETREHLGGFWVIEAPDRDAAVVWAGRASEALRGLPLEVRAVGGVGG
jgi:hypothetical protein